MRAEPRQQQRDLAADPAPAADNQRDLPAEFTLRRHPLQLRFLERPVLDAKRFAPRQRDVVVKALEPLRLLRRARLRKHGSGAGIVLERRRAGHHVDGVREELRRDSRLALVFAEAVDAKPRNDDHRRVRVAQRGEPASAQDL